MWCHQLSRVVQRKQVQCALVLACLALASSRPQPDDDETDEMSTTTMETSTIPCLEVDDNGKTVEVPCKDFKVKKCEGSLIKCQPLIVIGCAVCALVVMGAIPIALKFASGSGQNVNTSQLGGL